MDGVENKARIRAQHDESTRLCLKQRASPGQQLELVSNCPRDFLQRGYSFG